MLKYWILSVLVLQKSKGVLSQRNCNDCILVNKCEAALNLLRNNQGPETENLIRASFCHYEDVEGVLVIKVCCSEFPPVHNSSNNSDSGFAVNSKLSLLPKKCGGILRDRIVGGKKAKLYEFPWMVVIYHDTRYGVQFKCGGSIINKKYILTAAHCVVGKIIAGVRVGEYNIVTETDCYYDKNKTVCESHIQNLNVSEIIPHENYKRLPTTHDIALLRVDGEIFFNYPNIDPICLPTSPSLRNIILDSKVGTIAGWGVTENGTESAELLTVDVTIKSSAECKDFYNRYNEKNINKHLCAGGLEKGSCNGDSGGPLMVIENYYGANSYVEYGIHSYGPVKCTSNFPGVYTDVREYIDWILDNIKE